MSIFLIEDEIHAEIQGEFHSYADAIELLKQRAIIPWSVHPNKPPCISWETCHRLYQIVEYDNSQTPWIELDRKDVLDISASGISWLIKV